MLDQRAATPCGKGLVLGSLVIIVINHPSISIPQCSLLARRDNSKHGQHASHSSLSLSFHTLLPPPRIHRAHDTAISISHLLCRGGGTRPGQALAKCPCYNYPSQVRPRFGTGAHTAPEHGPSHLLPPPSHAHTHPAQPFPHCTWCYSSLWHSSARPAFFAGKLLRV